LSIAVAPTSVSRRRERILWSVTIVLVAAAAIAAPVIWTHLTEVESTAPRVQFTIAPPSGMSVPAFTASVAVSPNGTHVVFTAAEGGRARLVLRDLASGALTPLPHTGGVEGIPFWSPDSDWIAFVADEKLKRTNMTTARRTPFATCLSGYWRSCKRRGRDLE
jgi:hypothetical protein